MKKWHFNSKNLIIPPFSKIIPAMSFCNTANVLCGSNFLTKKAQV